LAKIIVYTHEYDSFTKLRWAMPPRIVGYFLYDVLREAEAYGHSWRVVKGARRCEGDVAIMHVDATMVSPEYIAMGDGFACAVNFATPDISKRKVSESLLAKGDDWDGRVIVKSNLNYGGAKEVHHNRVARLRGARPPHPDARETPGYHVLESIAAVSDEIWNDDARVVERFLPEPDPQGYALRIWKFLGDSETCMRHVAAEPIVKGRNTIAIHPVPVSPELRDRRRRLGLDYGKFDYVVHDGKVVLLDVNRTPGVVPRLFPKALVQDFARGLDGLIRGRNVSPPAMVAGEAPALT
jgi:hypothetical protein